MKSIKGIKVRMHLSPSQNRKGERVWRFEAEDVDASSMLIVIDFDDATFADLMSHSTHGNVGVAEVFRSENVGRIHENQVVHVECERGMGMPAIFDAAEAAHPGWTADHEDRWNAHRYVGGKYAVTLRRWVAR